MQKSEIMKLVSEHTGMDNNIVSCLEKERANVTQRGFCKKKHKAIPNLSRRTQGVWNYALLLANRPAQSPKRGSIGWELFELNRIYFTHNKLDASLLSEHVAAFSFETLVNHFNKTKEELVLFVQENNLINEKVLIEGPKSKYVENLIGSLEQTRVIIQMELAGKNKAKNKAAMNLLLRELAKRIKIPVVVNGRVLGATVEKTVIAQPVVEVKKDHKKRAEKSKVIKLPQTKQKKTEKKLTAKKTQVKKMAIVIESRQVRQNDNRKPLLNNQNDVKEAGQIILQHGFKASESKFHSKTKQYDRVYEKDGRFYALRREIKVDEQIKKVQLVELLVN